MSEETSAAAANEIQENDVTSKIALNSPAPAQSFREGDSAAIEYSLQLSKTVSPPEESNSLARKRSFDESYEEDVSERGGGEGDEDDMRKVEARRAYNRKCAARARKRNKDLIASLHQQVHELQGANSQLERTLETMRAQMNLLEQQNRTLMLHQQHQQHHHHQHIQQEQHRHHYPVPPLHGPYAYPSTPAYAATNVHGGPPAMHPSPQQPPPPTPHPHYQHSSYGSYPAPLHSQQHAQRHPPPPPPPATLLQHPQHSHQPHHQQRHSPTPGHVSGPANPAGTFSSRTPPNYSYPTLSQQQQQQQQQPPFHVVPSHSYPTDMGQAPSPHYSFSGPHMSNIPPGYHATMSPADLLGRLGHSGEQHVLRHHQGRGAEEEELNNSNDNVAQGAHHGSSIAGQGAHLDNF